jgi:ubiquinone biosynthesis protein UbiJ
VRASIVQSVPADQQATILAILDAVRAQGNAQIAQLLATC